MDLIGKVVFTQDDSKSGESATENECVDDDMYEEIEVYEEGDDGEILYYDEYEEGEMDAEYAEFVAITRKHQRERDALKELNRKLEAMTIYKDLKDVDIQNVCKPNTITADKEVAYKVLYGNLWQSVRSKESILQNAFNKIWDEKKPLFWPTIPIRL